MLKTTIQKELGTYRTLAEPTIRIVCWRHCLTMKSPMLFDTHAVSRHTNQQNLGIDPRRLMSKLLHVLNVRPRINSGMAVRAALAAQFQHT
jgi:hypothetical protein